MATTRTDPARLAALEAIADRELGAARRAQERTDDAARAWQSARASLVEIERAPAQNAPDREDRLAAARKAVEETEAAHRAARAVVEAAQERWNSAGNLVARCREWLEDGGRK